MTNYNSKALCAQRPLLHKNLFSSLLTHSGLLLSAGISLALTITFFSSLANSGLTLVLFIGIALVFELLKLRTLQLLPQSLLAKKRGVLTSVVVLYLLLALLSWCASLGSLTSNASLQQQSIERVRVHNAHLHTVMESIQKSITQNDESIQFYRQKQLIQLRVRPLQKANAVLREQLQQAQSKMLPVPNASAMNSVIESIQKALGIAYSTANLMLSGLLSLLLEIACAVFVMLSVAERIQRTAAQMLSNKNVLHNVVLKNYKPHYNLQNASGSNIYKAFGMYQELAANTQQFTSCNHDTDDANISLEGVGTGCRKASDHTVSKVKTAKKSIAFSREPHEHNKLSYNEGDIIRDIKNNQLIGEGALSKRRILRHYQVGAKKVDQLFERLLTAKIIRRTSSGRYYPVMVA